MNGEKAPLTPPEKRPSPARLRAMPSRQTAIVWAEILDKPLALRKKR